LKHSASAGQPRADARAGFALIEMLAGLTIAVAILALLAQFTSQSLRNWNRGESTIAVMEMLTTGLGRLKTDLALAVPMRAPGSDNPSVMFSGDAGQLLFVAATGFGAGNRGLELVSVNMTRDADGVVALVRQRGQVTTGPTPLRDPVVLLHGRMQFAFSYRDEDGQTLTSWTNRERLPKAVVLDLRNTAGVSVFPTPVVFNVPTNMAAACISGDGGDGGDGGNAGGCPGQQQRTRRGTRTEEQEQQ
jgi:general secretion pathway protein J